ncbi:autotransporter [Novosphingobium sp. Fuku2-ISO-50]|nr:autotransporter [Novosphingobium sp. Fuku2-ISO-50]
MLMQRQFSQFLASTAPVALGVAAGLMAAAPAYADTTVNSGTTATYNTSTAGNVTVSGTGTLTGASGAVITVDSSNTATVNSGGTLYAGTASSPLTGNIGILANPGVTTTLTNAGTISVLENFTPQTINGTVVFSALSGVSNRYGIYGAAGGTLNAAISNTGAIYVDGENSAGIQIDSTLNGSLNTQGTITVLGDNSYGVKLANVTGNVTIGGTVTVTGSAAQGYLQAGNVAGQILIDGAISNSSGYTDSSGTSLTLALARINTGTPIVEIDGSVTGGILVNAPTSSTSSDTNRGSISAYGNNPALQIGGASAITIGAGTTDNGTYALGIDGSVTATASQSNTNAYAVVIGKAGGGAVTLTNGMEVYGTVSATTQNASATAILINSNATVASILNTGTIKAVSNGESTGNIYAIQDLSGTVSTLTNQGYITASGTTSGTTAAIDLSKNTTGVTLTQSYTSTNLTNESTDQSTAGYNAYTATEYAGITGDILLGTGNNTINIESGTVNGNAVFGAGGSNTVDMADTTRWVGNITFGAGGTQTIAMSNYAQFNGNLELSNDAGSLTINNSAIFLGSIYDGSNFDVVVNGGTFGANAATTSTLKSLTVASGGSLSVFVDGTSGTASKLVANTATFASGAKITVTVNSLKNPLGTFDVLGATTLTGASTLTSSSLNLPVLFSGSVSTGANTTAGTSDVYVTIARATAAQLGLTAAQTAAYGAIINDAAANTNIQNTLLQIYDTPTLRGRFNEMLPNYSGGTFDIVSRATRLANKHFDDDTTMFSISDSSAWLEPIVFSGTRAFGDTAGFKTTGGGLSAGYEKVTPVGNVGFQLAWLTGDAKAGTYQSVKTSAFELGLFWRKSSGPLYLWAGGNLGRESFNSTRTFFGTYTTSTTSTVTTTNFTYSAAGHWAGWSAALTAGASYTVPLGDHFSLRPRGVVEYDHLKENAYIEGGDTPIALSVAGRTNSETTATTTLAAKWSSGPSTHEGRPFAVELEAGRRSWLAGNIGTTTATFETGDTFSINGGHLPSAWIGQLSIMQGGLDYTWKIGTDIERGADKGVAYGVRASISIAL